MRITIHLTPGSKKRSIVAIPGQPGMFRAFVTARAEHGEANAALLSLIRTSWRIPFAELQLVSGQTRRIKIIEIDEVYRSHVPPDHLPRETMDCIE